MNDEVTLLEAKLAAIKAQREQWSEDREAALKAKRLAEQVAQEEQRAADDVKFAELVDKYGDGTLRRINTKRGMVVVRQPESIVDRRFRNDLSLSESPNPKVRKSFSDACDKYAVHCVVHPPRKEYEKFAEEFSQLTAAVVRLALELGDVQADDDEGK